MNLLRRSALVAIAAPLLALFSTLAAQAQSELCENPAGYCGRGISVECLSRLGAGAIAATGAGAGDACGSQLENYFDCVAKAAEQCGGSTGSGGGAHSGTGGPLPTSRWHFHPLVAQCVVERPLGTMATCL